MKKKYLPSIIKIFLPIFLSIIFSHCGNSEVGKTNTEIKRDTSITEENAFSELDLDSAKLESYIAEHNVDEAAARQMRDFYNSRNYHFAWFTADGLSEQARGFWNLHNSYVQSTKDSASYDKELHEIMQQLINDAEAIQLSPAELTLTELHLTQHFFDFSKYAYEGKVDPAELQWHIPRKKINPVALLDSLVKTQPGKLEKWEPVNEEYRLLKEQLVRYNEIDKKGGWPIIEMQEKVLKPGDSSASVVQLKQRLMAEGELASADLSHVYTPGVEAAVKQAQRRLGLADDGVVGPATVRELNVPVKERIKQMLVNLERMKWMPPKEEGTRLVANIPDFKLHVYEGDREAFTMRIVVGTAGNSSVIFSDKLEYVVFSPYWNVPASIVRNEILPAMQRNPNYLANANMEQTGTRNGLPVIRQKPGGSNSLGRVKFIFPNNYNIYFHDTPAKHLFDRNDRAFSHGCIRLEQPQRLAEYLLQDETEWTTSAITDAMYAGTEKWIKLDEKVPVLITYFTSWVEDGVVHFRNDIYGHDKKMMARLFEND
ncbi:L,D-transpeptidase family protein [Aridibaculum aurantiacum]|uniref:L,D-transpeptidase family protein n=1 Tax=Aridibaculum aurantiacum TaxID=2810307 RepID=UPI001A96752B|nr:L,D-transpeptidase family protein [Aridibaculum aurantiacum]